MATRGNTFRVQLTSKSQLSCWELSDKLAFCILKLSGSMGAPPQQVYRKGKGQLLTALELILGTQPFVAHPPLNFLPENTLPIPAAKESCQPLAQRAGLHGRF